MDPANNSQPPWNEPLGLENILQYSVTKIDRGPDQMAFPKWITKAPAFLYAAGGDGVEVGGVVYGDLKMTEIGFSLHPSRRGLI